MSAASLLPLSAERQERLLALLTEEGAEALFLRDVLQLCRETTGAESLAAYLANDGMLECCARLGNAELPSTLEAAAALPWPSRPVAGGLLVAAEPFDADLP